MSRHHYTHATEAHGILHDITVLSQEELTNNYGIIFTPEGVFDPVTNKKFKSLQEWAEKQIQEEKWAEAEHLHANSRKYDNEF